ncbi:MAG TPA: NmrA family NAD(P)-binding protein [Ktedonobacterales bacterium]
MILVTGAGGMAGTAVLRALAVRGQSARAVVRSVHGAERARAAGASDVVIGDMTRADDMEEAARGVRAICHITPSQTGDEPLMARCVIAAAQATGVERLVYFGSINLRVDTAQHRDKLQTETEIVEAGLPYTFLHPSKFMQGILPLWREITERGVFRVPYSVTTPMARVDTGDMGDAAATVLLDSGHLGATYELVGQAPISEADMCVLLAASLGRPVRAETMPTEEWASAAAARGMGSEHITRSLQMFDFFTRLGSPHESTHTLSWLIGRPPTDFRQFIERLVATSSSTNSICT